MFAFTQNVENVDDDPIYNKYSGISNILNLFTLTFPRICNMHACFISFAYLPKLNLTRKTFSQWMNLSVRRHSLLSRCVALPRTC